MRKHSSWDSSPHRPASRRVSSTTLLSRMGAVGLSLALLAAGCGTDPTETPAGEAVGPSVTLRFGHGFPSEHVLQRELLEPWAEEIAEASGGSITIDIHAGGALVEAPPAYENIVAGVADLGWSIQGYTPGRFPLTEVIELPLLFDSAVQATEALWDLYEESPALQDEYADVEVLALWTLSPGELWTRQTPITSLDDVAGLSLRAPGRVQIGMIESFGASPLTMPAPEIFDALERGVMDGLVIDPVGVAAFGLQDVLNHGFVGGFYATAMFMVMNQATWEGLSAEQQELLDREAGRELSLRIAQVFDDASAGIMERIGDEVEIVVADDLEPWQAATTSVIEDWIAEREAEGHPAQELFDRLMATTSG